ncbi:alpha/beta fold hydrolase [Vacuolonema iberomarrocanum]|uniref:alpha/beta fold hydrolase n=1 Tax=Vacuolonema iberomarrocanum TaxID=3454632 RepID=UPI0019F8397B|nr:alpha/beta fold hydrolase [filamentous cyanobacterium LEGE 07170]
MTSSAIAPASLTRQSWQWKGHSICYTVQGSGTPVVLLHGFGASIGHWRKNLPVLADAGYQVYAIDLLGFGASDKPAIAYSLEMWEELLVDFWQDKIQQPTVWVGNSIGALLVLMLLAHHPEVGRAGALLNAAGGLNHRPEELNLPLRVVMGTFAKVVNSRTLGPFLFNRVRQKSRIRGTLKQVYCDNSAVTDELVDLLYEPSCDPGAQKVFAAILAAPPGPQPTELLPKVTQPLRVIWGAADPWTPISGSKPYQELAATEPDRVQFTALPETGHCPHDERPDEVNALLLDWLAQI